MESETCSTKCVLDDEALHVALRSYPDGPQPIEGLAGEHTA